MSNGNAYVDRVWYSVIWKDTGKKYCDCGWEMDAQRIVSNRPHLLTYVRNDHHLYGQTVDVTPQPALPTNEIVVNMDGGVGGSWEEREIEMEPAALPSGQNKLQAGQQEPFVV
jgi:hypothetical protein